MKKVLFTATVDSHILQFHLPFLKYFKDNGYEVHVATGEDGEIPYCDKKINVGIVRSPYSLKNIKAIKKLKKIIMNEKYDIIHTHTPMGSVVTRMASKKARKKYHTRVIYTAHGFHFYKGAPKKNWLLFYPVEKHLSKYTDTLITINNEDYELAKHKFKKCKDIQYVPGVGIDENKFNFEMTKKEKSDLRKSLGLKDNDFVMICVARLDANKNQGLLIDITRKLIKKHKNIHLLLVGPDQNNGKYQEEAKDILKNVHFLGFRKDIAKLLKISDLALSSSIREGLPVNIMEAMVIGLPIVATNARGNRDLVKNHINGYIVDFFDVDKFTDCIEKIYNSNKSNDKFKKESQYIIKEYTLDKIMKKMIDIYNKKKKILHVLASNKYSGAENVACTIIENMSDKYDMAYCSPDGPIKDILKEKNIKFYEVKKLNINNLKKTIKEYNPNIIHAHDFKASIYASLFYKKCNVISHIHKNDPKMKKLSLKSILYLFVSKKLYKIVGVSDSILNEYIFKNKIENKYMTIFNYIDKDKIIEKSNEFKVEKEYDLFFFGRLSKEKNPLMFIEIVNKLNDKNVKCVMIGDGPLYDECKNKIKEYQLEKNIDMVGFKSNPFPYIKASKIGIMPSIYEGFGLTAIESSILNKPVLNSGVGGLKEIFKDNQELICNNIKDYLLRVKKNLNNNYIIDIKKIEKNFDIGNYKVNINKIYD